MLRGRYPGDRSLKPRTSPEVGGGVAQIAQKWSPIEETEVCIHAEFGGLSGASHRLPGHSSRHQKSGSDPKCPTADEGIRTSFSFGHDQILWEVCTKFGLATTSDV